MRGRAPESSARSAGRSVRMGPAASCDAEPPRRFRRLSGSRRSPEPPFPPRATGDRPFHPPVPLGLLVQVVVIAVEDHLPRELAGKFCRTTLLHDGQSYYRSAPRRRSCSIIVGSIATRGNLFSRTPSSASPRGPARHWTIRVVPGEISGKRKPRRPQRASGGSVVFPLVVGCRRGDLNPHPL
jgi:hypothetical protein